MNKLVKGSIAGAAGIALLLGGAGTLAYWNDSTTLATGTVTAGELDIVPGVAGVWKRGATAIDPATFRIVPGDTVVFTDDVTVNAVGDKLSFELTTNIPSLVTPTTGGIAGTTTAQTFAVTKGGVAQTANALGVYTLGQGTYTVTATVTVAFPFGDVGNQSGMNQSLDLSTAFINVKQVLVP